MNQSPLSIEDIQFILNFISENFSSAMPDEQQQMILKIQGLIHIQHSAFISKWGPIIIMKIYQNNPKYINSQLTELTELVDSRLVSSELVGSTLDDSILVGSLDKPKLVNEFILNWFSIFNDEVLKEEFLLELANLDQLKSFTEPNISLISESEKNIFGFIKYQYDYYTEKIKAYLTHRPVFTPPPPVPSPSVPSPSVLTSSIAIFTNVCHGAFAVDTYSNFKTTKINLRIILLRIAPINTCSWGDYKTHIPLFSQLLTDQFDTTTDTKDNALNKIFGCIKKYGIEKDWSLQSTNKLTRSNTIFTQGINSACKRNDAFKDCDFIDEEFAEKMWTIDFPNPFIRDPTNGRMTTSSRGIEVMRDFRVMLPAKFLSEITGSNKVNCDRFIQKLITQIHVSYNFSAIANYGDVSVNRIGQLQSDGTIIYYQGSDILACPYFILFNIFILSKDNTLTPFHITKHSSIMCLNFPSWRTHDLNNPNRVSKIYMVRQIMNTMLYAYLINSEFVGMYDTSCSAIYSTHDDKQKIVDTLFNGNIKKYRDFLTNKAKGLSAGGGKIRKRKTKTKRKTKRKMYKKLRKSIRKRAFKTRKR